MERDRNAPNQASNKSKAEGERWSSESDTVEERDKARNVDERMDAEDEGGGISNRPLGEEIENQERLPDRGESRERSRDGDNRINEEE